jgi:starch phosphorylase
MLIEEIGDQTGKVFDPEVLTIVWARRFAGYKRPALLFRDYNRFFKLITRKELPVQIVWAGKPYPEDKDGIEVFNNIVNMTSGLQNCAILTGYELKLSGLLKKGADVWLNTPRPPQEASGTSGMSAAMNAAINLSFADGWFPEFANHGTNSYVIPSAELSKGEDVRNTEDNMHLMNVLEKEVIPTYYNEKAKWLKIVKASMTDIIPRFDSDRMVKEYYENLYNS